ncbi:DUF3817 domain-containing protein [Paenibacillus thalictri]|uniref:DUF3817 domain-containing protein n=1 Tax=Paenibacillus thalictri TaxID=2527873 RepID=A0A4Q9DNZ0_9BACL|nr:DUF3817 domain-containing protein [Paenibacillus thalictri]TBL75685.1 DUF3817 domain-containing protein [Paenibacillus thalictri]
MKKTAALSFRIISFMEGISFLLLLFIAMPLKYFADMPGPVSVTGMIHGVLFVLYLVAMVMMAVLFRWKIIRIIGAIFASLLPFGPFVLDARIKKTPH